MKKFKSLVIIAIVISSIMVFGLNSYADYDCDEYNFDNTSYESMYIITINSEGALLAYDTAYNLMNHTYNIYRDKYMSDFIGERCTKVGYNAQQAGIEIFSIFYECNSVRIILPKPGYENIIPVLIYDPFEDE